MKKIILFIFLFAGIISSQTTTSQKNRIDGKYTQWKSAGGDTVSTGVHVTNSTMVLPTGGATSANQSTQITRADTTINRIKDIFYRLYGQATAANQVLHNTKLDSLDASSTRNEGKLDAIKTSVELLDNSVDGNYLNVNTNFAGVDATTNIGNANATTQRVVLASDQPTIPVTLSPLDTVTVKKVVDALPAGTNIIGKVGIDQTTPGTTNKVSIGTDGTVTANAGTNLNTSLLALETGGNLATIAGKDFATQTTLALIKAKTDNIDNATSTLATTANQTNGTQTTMLTGSPNSYSVWFSTAGTVKDSVSYGFTTRSVTFINDGVSTDTLFVSPTSTFPSTNTIKRLGGEGFTKQWAVTKLYFKVGTTPVASKKIRIEAQ